MEGTFWILKKTCFLDLAPHTLQIPAKRLQSESSLPVADTARGDGGEYAHHTL